MINKGLFSSINDSYCTPIDFFNVLDQEFNFNLDLCASDQNHLCINYFTKDNSCLDKNICNMNIFCNPPYGRKIGLFVKKCYDLQKYNNVVVMLLPARTDTKWFHDYIYHNCEIRFIKGRLKFSGSKNSAPFPSMICIFRRCKYENKK